MGRLRSVYAGAWRTVAAALGCGALASVACGGSSSSDVGRVVTTPTFSRDVAPIIAGRCAACHHQGGSAPFALTDFASVRQRGRLVRAAVQARFMPPWLPEPIGVAFTGDRHLTDAEIHTIVQWVDAGMPEGDPADMPEALHFSNAWQLGEPDLVVRLPRPYTLPATGSDVWRNFVIPIPVTARRYVQTIEIRPGSARFVHHALIAVDETGASRRRDTLDPEPGFEGMDMGEAHMPDGSILGWTPGVVAKPEPADLRWPLNPGTDMVLQLHMVPSGKAEVIDPVIGLHFAEVAEAGSPAYAMQLDADDQVNIPPEAAAFSVTDTMTLPVDAEVLAAYPHAHFLGTRVEGWATLPDGSRRQLLKINRWDFKWQDVYRFAVPVALPRGASVTMEWTFDNSSANPRQVRHPAERVTAGNRSSDEMAHLLLQLRFKTNADRDLLKQSHYEQLVQRSPRNARLLYGLAGVLKDRGQLAAAAAYYQRALDVQPDYVSAYINLGGVLAAQNRNPEAIEHFRTAARLDPDGVTAHFNLAFVLGVSGRLEEAIASYRQALRSRPDFAPAHNNLGQVLAAVGRVDEALAHLREAARLLPDSAEIHQNLGQVLQARGDAGEARRELERARQLAETGQGR